MQRPLHDSSSHSGLIHTCAYCAEYTGTHPHSHEAISFCVMIAHFRGRQQTQRRNGFILIVHRDQYPATLIFHSQRKSSHLRMLVCHNTLFISYSSVSYSKLNSAHPKRLFHAWIHLDDSSKCALSSFVPSPCTDTVCAVLIAGKVITTTPRFPAPGAFIPLVCTVRKLPHVRTPLPSPHPFNCPNQSLYRILACQSGGPVNNSLITFLSLQTHFPYATPVSVTLHRN